TASIVFMYILSLHDALPIFNQQFSKLTDSARITTYDDSHEMKKDITGLMEQKLNDLRSQRDKEVPRATKRIGGLDDRPSGDQNLDRKSTRLNSSHQIISYAV